MPNWVYSSLVVSGDKSELDKMVAHLNTPFDKHFPDSKWNDETKSWDLTPAVQHFSNPVFAFWNICRPENLNAYYGESTSEVTMENFAETFSKAVKTDPNWYYWNLDNWGAKWDVAVGDKGYSSTSMEWTDNGSVMYRFETAWSPVKEAITKLSEMYPSLEFDYEYEEEQGWGGSATVIAGDYAVTREWDIPESHADYSGTWMECSCENGLMPETAYYSDCPVDTEMYKWDGEEWQEKTLDTSVSL